MTRTAAFIQARMSSSRLPGKVLQPLSGLPLIVYMAQRVSHARLLDEVVVVTSTDRSDDVLADAVVAAGVKVFRGDLDDVLQRFADAAQAFGVDEIVRLTGDCPLMDPALVDAVVALRRSQASDYASNVAPPSFPDGMDVECFTRATLDRAQREARRRSEREHVTLWMRSDEVVLRRANLSGPVDLSALRLTVDYADDLALVRRLVDGLAMRVDFDLFDILRALWQIPDPHALNPHQRNEGLARSLAAEQTRQP